jgi:hypothetical protein
VSGHSEQRLGVNKGLNTRLQFNRQIARLEARAGAVPGGNMPTFRTLIIAAFTILLPATTSPARAEERRLMHAAPYGWEDIPHEYGRKMQTHFD